MAERITRLQVEGDQRGPDQGAGSMSQVISFVARATLLAISIGFAALARRTILFFRSPVACDWSEDVGHGRIQHGHTGAGGKDLLTSMFHSTFSEHE